MKLTKKEQQTYNQGLLDDFQGNEKEWWKIHEKTLKKAKRKLKCSKKQA